jgi:DNA invertase Pin-like site-specific DNA recombinase
MSPKKQLIMRKNYNDYYVYQYLNSNGTIYYIGKGRGNRAYRKHSNTRVPLNRDNIIILEKDLSENDSLLIESGLIKFHGLKKNGTGTLDNSHSWIGAMTGGRSKTDSYQKEMRALREEGYSMEYIAKKYSIARSTVFLFTSDIKVDKDKVKMVAKNGRPTNITENTKKQIKDMVEQGLTTNSITKTLKIGMGSFYKIIEEIKKESNEFSQIYDKFIESRKRG